MVKEKLRDIKFRKFKIEIGGIGVFSEKFIRIVWLHLKGAEELQKIIDDKLKSLFIVLIYLFYRVHEIHDSFLIDRKQHIYAEICFIFI